MTDSQDPGKRISYDGALCTVRYVGDVAGTNGIWLGVEWDDAARGKHNGSHRGTRYFTCISKSPTAASFVRPTRPADKAQSFIAALSEKYVSQTTESEGGAESKIMISGKVAEEMGFDKIRRKQAQVKELKIVILDGMRISTATKPGEDTIAETSPNIMQLDLSRNLLESFGPALEICRNLPALRRLSLNGNRLKSIMDDDFLEQSHAAFRQVRELSLEETLLDWNEICRVASQCESLATLHAGSNQLSSLPNLDYLSLTSTLTSLILEYNDFAAVTDLSSLTALKSLRNLNLKGNNMGESSAGESTAPVFPDTLQFLDVSYNQIQNWTFVDRLAAHFPGLTALRISHNPVYDIKDADTKASSSEESHMFTIARLASLKSLNFTPVTATVRTNAEMFYLSRIAKQLATVPEPAESSIIEQHPRYAELCEIYGEPDVIRREEINPSFLEARLITVGFHYHGQGKTARIPKSFDVYAVKGMAGKLFSLPPLKLGLVWETGEWDPVAGFDEREGDSSDEEESHAEIMDDLDVALQSEETDGKPGHWVKREVQLTDGPKQLGYCVDGSNVTIRIEQR